MNIIFNAEEEELMRSIITDENWINAPEEEVFYDTLESIKQNSDLSYKHIIEDIIKMLKNHKYIAIKEEVNELIKYI